MSVSDPLIKQLKVYAIDLRTAGSTVTDGHPFLQPFCQTLEMILRKGLNDGNSLFGKTNRDYWWWISKLAMEYTRNTSLKVAVGDITASVKAVTPQGKGRFFLRVAMQKKLLELCIKELLQYRDLLAMVYNGSSIFTDEILSEIFVSLLKEISLINFDLNVNNAAFLDVTWTLPLVCKCQFVPCEKLGLGVQFTESWPVIVEVDEGSIVDGDSRIDTGDILESLYDTTLRGCPCGKLSKMLEDKKGFPVNLTVLKHRLADGTMFPPALELIRKAASYAEALQKIVVDEEVKRTRPKLPAHAILPEDMEEEIPIYHSDDRAMYKVAYVGKTEVGLDGRVEQIEGAVGRVLRAIQPEDNPDKLMDVEFLLDEKDVIISSLTSEPLWRHSYTEISSCGRRKDCLLYFAYIAGETTCTLAREFVAYVFKAQSEEDSKCILCSIAQGFDRTHWFV